ncbi:MAG: family 14 glycosylhydrolase [Bacteroidota bacterium]
MPGEIVVCGIPFGTEKEREALAYVKENGFTSVQIYTYWRNVEPSRRGFFDWSFYDRQVELIQEAGLKYVPFFLMGPRYAAPDWWLEDPGHRGLVCLEHGRENPVESIWNPAFRDEISRVLAAFAGHYLPWAAIESIQPGICGDYGEAIFPVLGNWPGAYHTHPGFWCGGNDAVESFRDEMRRHYGTIGELNAAWRSSYRSFAEIGPFLRHLAPSRTAFLDLVRWYRGAMTEYAAFWMRECRKYFPATPIYLCTGGMEEPEHGSSFAGQAKAAAAFEGGIRLTNEGNDFYDNYYLTAHMYAACRHYGAYLGLEPVGPMLPQGVTTRTFGSIAHGNRQIFHYYGNLAAGAAESVRKSAALIGERKPEITVAFFWPLDQAALEGRCIPDEIKTALSFVRRHYEVLVLGEELILDGALRGAKLLIMLEARYTREEVLEEIARWVKRGGTVLSNARTVNIEGVPVKRFDEVFGFGSGAEEVWGHCDYHPTGVPWAERFNTVEKIHAEKGWIGLAGGVVRLAENEPHREEHGMPVAAASCCFENRHGEGRGIFYSTWLHLDARPEAIFAPTRAFEYLLYDCCQQFGGSKALGLREGEVARARAGDGHYVLTDTIAFLPE